MTHESERGQSLDLASEPTYARDQVSSESSKRPFLGVRFTCCDVYTRAYFDRGAESLTVHCPRCLRPLKLIFDPLGSTARIFEAG